MDWKDGRKMLARATEIEKQFVSVQVDSDYTYWTKPEGVTFDVAEVTPCTERLPATSHVKNITDRICGKIESCYMTDANIISEGKLHALVEAVHIAYDKHFPLVLSPDMIWLCITQGFAQHINKNPKKFRKMFVSHSGKKEIVVERADFVKGLATNPWPEVFGEFSQKIKDEIGKKNYDLITPNFSTTGAVEKAVGDIVLMDTMQSYFTYGFETVCGIPSITLEGTKEDWISVREKAAKLERYDLKWWIPHLLPILDQFVNASRGEVDRDFWSSIYKDRKCYNGLSINGWIVTLFPYLESGTGSIRNYRLTNWSTGNNSGGIMTNMFSSGLSRAPFLWNYHGKRLEMKFVGGFMAVSQDWETLAKRPEIGWAVYEDDVSSGRM